MKPLPTKVAVSVLVLMLIAPHLALAHAFLDHAEPRVGAKVAKAPQEVRIWFTQELEPAFSNIRVFDSEGKQVDKKDSHLDPKDKSVLIVSLPSSPAGTYKVAWRVVSVDTHRTDGDFKFVVQP
jgi:methionine-rich copper-binding protein CopC